MEQRLTFLALSDQRTADGHLMASYLCACGNITAVACSRVKNGYTRSCGCLARDTKPRLKHGQRHSREYQSWSAMRTRCLNPASKDYPRWGGRGVTICKRWESFEAFRQDMGPRPNGTTLDRIDPNKGYSPDNCRWATRSEQQRNKLKSKIYHIRGEHFETLQEAADHFGVRKQSVRRWVEGSFDARRGTHTPAREDCYATAKY